MTIKLKKVGFAFLLSSCFIMPLLAMDQAQQPQEQNQQQGLTSEEELSSEILQWIRNPNRLAIEQFSSQHEDLSQLQKLDLRGEDIGNDGAIALATAFQYLTQLQGLNLSGNNIGYNGAQALAGALPYLTQLQKLNLSGNNIGDDGVKELLAAQLNNFTQLQELYLGNNNIGYNGAAALAGALQRLTQLKKLGLSHNAIEGDGADVLFKAADIINVQRPEDNKLLILGVEPPLRFNNEEVIVKIREQTVTAYKKLVEEGIISGLIPKDEEVEHSFQLACLDWTPVVEGDDNAKQGLALLQDTNKDQKVPKHKDSEYFGYRWFPKLGLKDSSELDSDQASFYKDKNMPSIRQLVVVAHKLWKQIKQDRLPEIKWVQNWLAERIQLDKATFRDPFLSTLVFSEFKKLVAQAGFNYSTADKMSNLLLEDQINNFPLYEALTKPDPVINPLKGKYFKQFYGLRSELQADWAPNLEGQLDPSAAVKLEFAFIRRGHGDMVTGTPACAEGAYLHIMQLIGNLISIKTKGANYEFTKLLQGAELGACGGNQQQQDQQQQQQN